MSNFQKHGFLTLTGSTEITVPGAEGWKRLSITNPDDSSGNITITSTNSKTIGGRTQNGVIVVPGESASVGLEDSSIDGVVISVAANTTAKIMAVEFQNII